MIINSLSKRCIWNLLCVYANKVWLQSVRLVPALTFDKNRPSLRILITLSRKKPISNSIDTSPYYSSLWMLFSSTQTFLYPDCREKNMGLFSQVDIFPLLTFLRVISYKPTTFTTTRSHFEELFEFGWPSWLLLLLT